ncbi:MAG: TonB-dependent receptor plug domain-containing protein, partial [Bacteroidia bacterium]|nr:TonB-dependent receptor plug domain-containing protein [Bacteroidia bacterium]
MCLNLLKQVLRQNYGKCFYFLTVLLGLSITSAFAQQNITGTITTPSGEPLPGVSVIAKGTTTGTVSGVDGTYRLTAPDGVTTLVFTFVGMQIEEREISGQSIINIQMIERPEALDEIVVTALGIEREEKALGYAVQEIQGNSLTEARETNLVSSLAGKIAGVTIVNNPSGIGSSARITIRGERSLNINKNQPLFVVDGVPISNEFFGSSGRSNQDADYGNGAGFINPDDVESITVLKGGAAAALYGSRANNGVIVIKTKSGKGSHGIGLSVNTTVSFETPLILPDYQNVYGQGLNGQFTFVDGLG